MDIRAPSRPEGPVEPTGAQSIARAAALLRLVAARRGQGGSLAEIVAAAGLSKPTVRRMLLALMDAGLVEQDPLTRRYFLGPETYALGAIAAERFGIHRIAQESVKRLARETGDAAFLQIRRDDMVVCVQREDGDFPLRSHVLAPGDRHPLGVGAGGIALLAALPPAEAEAIFERNLPAVAARYPQLEPQALRDAAAEARARGYSMNRGLVFPGSWGMGVAVADAEGLPTVCLSIAAVESRMKGPREADLAALLRREAERLAARIQDFSGRGEDRATGPADASPRRRAGEKR